MAGMEQEKPGTLRNLFTVERFRSVFESLFAKALATED
jgi:hypothetical protein